MLKPMMGSEGTARVVGVLTDGDVQAVSPVTPCVSIMPVRVRG